MKEIESILILKELQVESLYGHITIAETKENDMYHLEEEGFIWGSQFQRSQSMESWPQGGNIMVEGHGTGKLLFSWHSGSKEYWKRAREGGKTWSRTPFKGVPPPNSPSSQ